MNAPSVWTMLLGNPLGFLLGLGAGGWVLYSCYVNPTYMTSGGPPLLGVAIIVVAIRARVRYAHYQTWKHSLEAMSGVAAERAATRAKGRRMLPVTGSILLVAGSAWWIDGHARSDPNFAIAAGLVIGIPCVWLMVGLWRALRWLQSKRQAAQGRGEKAHVVSAALSTGRGAPTASDASDELPDYAKELLSRNRNNGGG